MIAELAIANAAYKTIKASLVAGRELHAVGVELAAYFGAKSELSKKVESSSKHKSEIEEFFALEELKVKEAELKQWMIYCGRGGLWDDWINFQAQCARDRKDAVRDEAIRKQKRYNALQANLKTGIKAGFIILIIMGALFGVAFHFYEK
jgi:hypothetical protein